VKRYAVALSVYGASRSQLCQGPRVNLIRPCLLSSKIDSSGNATLHVRIVMNIAQWCVPLYLSLKAR